jgi:hypothetical protein
MEYKVLKLCPGKEGGTKNISLNDRDDTNEISIAVIKQSNPITDLEKP